MPTGIEDILRNAKVAECTELVFEDDLERLSITVDDSVDSFRFTLPSMENSPLVSPSQRQGVSGRIRSTIKSAREFIASDAYITIKKDKLTVNGERQKLSIMCSKEKHHALLSADDRASLSGRVCSMDYALMGSKQFPLNNVFDSAMKGIVQARRSGSSEKIGVGPPVHVCLAWLCHAAQCSIRDVIPGGEVFPHAERYIVERMERKELPEVPNEDRTQLAVLQVCRVLDLLSVCDLRSQQPVDRSILMFAICRILLDVNSCCSIQYRSSLAIENILNASSLTKRATLVEFSNIFPLISDDLKNLQLCQEVVRLTNVDPSACLSLYSALLIHLSERAECEPSQLDSASEAEFADSHLGVVVDVLDDVMDVCENDDKKKCIIILMLDASLHPGLYGFITKERRQQLVEVLNRLRRELGTSLNPNGALTYRLLRNLMDRFEIQSNPESTTLPTV